MFFLYLFRCETFNQLLIPDPRRGHPIGEADAALPQGRRQDPRRGEGVFECGLTNFGLSLE